MSCGCNMTEEEKKLLAQAKKQDDRIKKLTATAKDQASKIAQQDKQIEDMETDKKKQGGLAKRLKGKADQTVGSQRVDQAIMDVGGSSAAQVLNGGEQALLNYLIETFPDSVGQHKVAMKSLPPVLALLWYLVEIVTMKKQASLFKKGRMQAANVLGNLGFLHLAQTYWGDRDAAKQTSKALAQDNATLEAQRQKLAEELASARKKLQDAGIG